MTTKYRADFFRKLMGFRATGLFFCLLLWLSLPLMADGTGIFTESYETSTNGNNRDSALGDLNGDGYPDMVLFGNPQQVFMNNGANVFSNSANFGSILATAGALGDLDGDGDADMVLANHDASDQVWMNDGLGSFTHAQSLGASTRTPDVAIEDVDNDGDKDVIFAHLINGNAVVSIHLNNGNSTFAAPESFTAVLNHGNLGTVYLILGDLNNDGYKDLVTTTTVESKVWHNNAGTFSYASHLNATVAEQGELGDINGDGYLDLVVVCNVPNDGYDQARAFLNDGYGNLNGTPFVLGGLEASDVGLDDFDDDGDLDCFVLYRQPATPNGHIFFNDGAAHFISGGHDYGVGGHRLNLGDLDKDGDTDLTIDMVQNTNLPPSFKSFLNNNKTDVIVADFSADTTSGNLPLAVSFQETSQVVGSAITSWAWDFDGDGITDSTLENPTYTYTVSGLYTVRLTVSNGTVSDTRTKVNYIHAGNLPFGTGFFEAGDNLALPSTRNLVAGDVDGDGDPDLMSVNGPHRIYLNDGTGNLTAGSIFGGTLGLDAAFGDLDGDGDQDLWIAKHDNPDEVWFNNGEGEFTFMGYVGNNTSDRQVILEDLDGDGDVDAVLARISSTYDGQVAIFLNHGNGTFATGSIYTLTTGSAYMDQISMTMGDVDNDGLRDIFFVSQKEDKVLLSNGDGTFSPGDNLGAGLISTHVSLGDIDGDDDLDALIVSTTTSDPYAKVRVWTNNGSGDFSDASTQIGNIQVKQADLADFDADGDLDLFIVSCGICTANMEVWFNNGYGSFSNSGQNLGTGGDVLVLADMNQDGAMDAAIARFYPTYHLEVWLNQTEEVPANIAVNYPNGGETLIDGDQYTLTWSAPNLTGNVDLALSQDGGITWTAIVADTPNDGAYSWLAIGASTQARLRVSATSDPGNFDISDANFNIVTPALRVLTPNGGESLLPGDVASITWNGSSAATHVKLEYSLNGGSTWQMIVSSTNNDGQYNWFIPGTGTVDGLIRVTSTANASETDTSNNPFTILTPSLSLDSHHGGVVMTPGTVTTLGFTVTNFKGGVNLDVSYDGGSTWTVIKVGAGNGPTYNWSVPAIGSTQVLFRVTSSYLPALTDVSDATNTILTPSLSLTSHNGGVQMTPGTVTTLSYAVVNFVGGVTLEVSYDGGTTWSMINNNLGNGPTTNWTVTANPSNLVVFRVTSRYLSQLSDTSDATNTIAMLLTSPNGGESLLPGDVASITWNGNPASTHVKLEYSLNGGTSWQMIVSSTNNDGQYNWFIPGTGTVNGLIRVTSTINPSETDTSNNPFTILTPSLSLDSHHGGVVMTPGTVTTLGFTVTNFKGGVNLDVSYDGGSTWTVIKVGAGNGPTYNWSVPAIGSSQVLFRVTSSYLPTLTDTSDATNTILTPSLSLTSHNGGVQMTQGTVTTLSYAVVNFVGGVTLEVSYDGGTTWSMINDNLGNGPTTNWTVTSTPSTQVVFRVTSRYLPQLSDTSDGTNTIQ